MMREKGGLDTYFFCIARAETPCVRLIWLCGDDVSLLIVLINSTYDIQINLCIDLQVASKMILSLCVYFRTNISVAVRRGGSI